MNPQLRKRTFSQGVFSSTSKKIVLVAPNLEDLSQRAAEDVTAMSQRAAAGMKARFDNMSNLRSQFKELQQMKQSSEVQSAWGV